MVQETAHSEKIVLQESTSILNHYGVSYFNGSYFTKVSLYCRTNFKLHITLYQYDLKKASLVNAVHYSMNFIRRNEHATWKTERQFNGERFECNWGLPEFSGGLLLEAYENGVISANKIKLFREKLDLERLRQRHSVQNIDECKQ